jgi:hypothetical protein
MFEVGKGYTIRVHDGATQSSFNAKLVKVELPLLVVEHDLVERVVDTSSPEFVSARRDDEETRAAELEKRQELPRVHGLGGTLDEQDD